MTVSAGTETAVRRLLRGPVGRAGGAAVVEGLPEASWLDALRQEAMAHYPHADRQDVDHDDGASGRGGTPARHLFTSGGGPVQDALYASPWLTDYLSTLCECRVVPTGTRGSYSYYVHEGDYLGLHLDIEACDITLITVLRDDAGPHDPAGGLLVHARHLGDDLHAVRRAPREGVGVIKAQVGASIVLLGGLLPHETVPVAAGSPRVISALCFAAV